MTAGLASAAWASPRRYRNSLRAVVVLLGAMQAWTARHAIHPDGPSYLDIADAYAEGRWSDALNSYWSPAYSWLVAAATWLLNPTPRWEIPVAHLLNFATYLAALVAFEFMLRQVMARHPRSSAEPTTAEGEPAVPDRWTLLLAYTLFAWGMLHLVGLHLVGPDLLLAAILFACFGLLARLSHREHRLRTAGWLGVALGAGCLTKSAMFPLTLVFLGAAAFRLHRTRAGYRSLVPALLGVAMVAGPWVYALSARAGGFTTGDSGRLNYGWLVNKEGKFGHSFGHWRGTPELAAGLQHPPRRIVDRPATFEFATPVVGVYPVWTDPAYWSKGGRVRFDLGNQKDAILGHLPLFFEMFLPLIVGLVALGVTIGSRSAARALWDEIDLLVPALAAIGMYMLVWFEGRYVGAFAGTIYLVSILAIDRAARARDIALGRGVMAGIALALCAVLIPQRVSELQVTALSALGAQTGGTPPWRIAHAVNQAGVQPGSRVALIGSGQWYVWARLASLRIVAEVQDRDVAYYWASGSTARARVDVAMASLGVRALIAEDVPEWAGEGWVRVEPGPHSIRILPHVPSATPGPSSTPISESSLP